MTPGALRGARRSHKLGVDWFLWRIVTSADIPDGWRDLEESWSLGDVVRAHEVLDELEAQREKHRSKG